MPLPRLAILLATTLALGACSREQPSAMPASAPAPTPAAPIADVPPPPPPSSPVGAPQPDALNKRIEPPEFDEQVAPLANTGFPVCDEYFEKARTCINTRLTPEARKIRGTELRNSARLISASAKGDVDLTRIEQNCMRLRTIGKRVLSEHGCTDL